MRRSRSPPYAEVLALGTRTRGLRGGAVALAALGCCAAMLTLTRPSAHEGPGGEPAMQVSLEPLASPSPGNGGTATVRPRARSIPRRSGRASPGVEVQAPSPLADAAMPGAFRSLSSLAGVSTDATGTALGGGGGAWGTRARASRARPARAVTYGWVCDWPHSRFDRAWVSLRVLVSATGKPLAVETFDATAPEFARMAQRCARDQSFWPAHDAQGRPAIGYTDVIKMYFSH